MADQESREAPARDAGALREARALLLLTRCARRTDPIDQSLRNV